MTDEQDAINKWDENNTKAWNKWLALMARDAMSITDMSDSGAGTNAWAAWARWQKLATEDYEAALAVLAIWRPE